MQHESLCNVIAHSPPHSRVKHTSWRERNGAGVVVVAKLKPDRYFVFPSHFSVGCVSYLHGIVGGRGSHWWTHEGRRSLLLFFPGIRITKISDSNLGQDWRSRTPTSPARKVHIAFVVFVWRECCHLRHQNIFNVCGLMLFGLDSSHVGRLRLIIGLTEQNLLQLH